MLEQLRNTIGHQLAYHVVVSIGIFIGLILLGWILKRFLATAGRRLAAKTQSELDDILLEILLPRIKWLSIIAASYLAIDEIEKSIPLSDANAHRIVAYITAAVSVLFIVAVTFLTIQLLNASIRHFVVAQATRTSSRVNDALIVLLNRLTNSLIVFIALIMVLGTFGVNVNSLLVFLGGGSVAVALAAQDTLSNMIAGFVIMIDRPFRVGDRIQLPSGEVGDVFEIGLRSTKILDFDNNMIINPNGDLIKTKIVNYSYPENHSRVSVDVGVAYGTDLSRAKTILVDLARNHPEILKEPGPEAFTIALGDSAVNLRLVGRTDDFRKRFRTETELRERIYDAFNREKIDIPFPQRVVRVLNGPS
ncbi:MAG TPA: mechanosensitive ion channel domain-containing protein [Bacteroidota bacterium]|nr:mechanosensitive ion channel domain-containing protein [Bacteroidota bacterium]